MSLPLELESFVNDHQGEKQSELDEVLKKFEYLNQELKLELESLRLEIKAKNKLILNLKQEHE